MATFDRVCGKCMGKLGELLMLRCPKCKKPYRRCETCNVYVCANRCASK